MTRGLTKFQEQDLFASVEKLEDIKKEIDNKFWHNDNYEDKIKINNEIDKTISIIKNIKPSIFDYPKVAKYIENPKDSQTNNTHLLNVVIQLTKIADELKKSNSLEHILTEDEKNMLCKCKDKNKK